MPIKITRAAMPHVNITPTMTYFMTSEGVVSINKTLPGEYVIKPSMIKLTDAVLDYNDGYITLGGLKWKLVS